MAEGKVLVEGLEDDDYSDLGREALKVLEEEDGEEDGNVPDIAALNGDDDDADPDPRSDETVEHYRKHVSAGASAVLGFPRGLVDGGVEVQVTSHGYSDAIATVPLDRLSAGLRRRLGVPENQG